jgi:hypothetical protein
VNVADAARGIKELGDSVIEGVHRDAERPHGPRQRLRA